METSRSRSRMMIKEFLKYHYSFGMLPFNFWNGVLVLLILIHFHWVQYSKMDEVGNSMCGALHYSTSLPSSTVPQVLTESNEEPILNIKYPMKPDVETFTRRPFKTEPRTRLNDFYVITYDATTLPARGEYDFRQDYTLKYFVGSTLEGTSRRRIELLSYDHYDVSIISQTTSSFTSPFMHRTERLFYFTYMLKRWQGYSFPLIDE